ncbi:hypothetical protein RSO01_41470 [Reyranella soli]|uniref:FAD-binding domain-containing protein n=1 Tax=Reyranella soli TaxID=1230389 RepID=A0A512NDF3_9HYPH|nr:hypothetical protein RSO01_41470 [Reyranella soli]
MPPWIGQGLNVGIRDAGNLAWKLAGVVRGQLTAAVLHTYESERRGHVEAMTKLADMFGAILMPISRFRAALRDQFFRLVRRLPSVRDYVLQMRFKPMPRYLAGFVLDESGSSSSPVGRMFIQPTVETADGRFVPLDTALGDWMVVLGWQIDPRSLLSDGDRDFWDSLDARFVTAMRSRSHGRDRSIRHADHVEDVENQLASWFAAANASIVVLRPDRYVAAVATASQFSDTTAAFRSLVRGRRAAEPPSTS